MAVERITTVDSWPTFKVEFAINYRWKPFHAAAKRAMMMAKDLDMVSKLTQASLTKEDVITETLEQLCDVRRTTLFSLDHASGRNGGVCSLPSFCYTTNSLDQPRLQKPQCHSRVSIIEQRGFLRCWRDSPYPAHPT